MDNHSVIGQTGKLDGTKNKPSQKWYSPVGLSLAGFILLSGAIGSLQHMIKIFTKDVYQVAFIENWIPWFAVLCFAFGWFITHWIEVVLSKNQLGVARVLFVVMLVSGLSISEYFRSYGNHEVLHGFSSAALFLYGSGYFLRLSVFRKENILLMQKAIFGKQLD